MYVNVDNEKDPSISRCVRIIVFSIVAHSLQNSLLSFSQPLTCEQVDTLDLLLLVLMLLLDDYG